VCKRGGLASLAWQHGAEADRLAALTRSGRAGVEECRPDLPGLDRPVFDHPIFWSAFQLVGRVT
jgi:CHAT domain-containing protein